MTTPMIRPLTTENRLLRATGGAQLRTSMGTALGAVFDSPTMGGLAVDSAQRSMARPDLPEASTEAFLADEMVRDQERLDLRAELADPALPEARKQVIYDRFAELGKAGDAQITGFERDQIASGRLQDPVALAEKYGDLGLKFDRPMSQEEADLLAEGKRAEIIRSALIEAGPKGFLPGAAKFGAGLLGMAVDPLEVATMFIPVVGQAGKVGAIARFGKVGGRVAVGAAEGGIGQAITEPLFYGLSRSAQLDYDMSDSLMNIGLGFAFGGGIGTVAGVFARADVPANRADVPDIDMPKSESLPPLRLTDDMRIEARRVMAEQRPVADLALRQFVTGQAIDVSQIMPRFSVEDAIAELRFALNNTAEFPLMNALKSIKIHPDGAIAGELNAAGITPKTVKGLFSKKGHRDLDNLVADEWESNLPGISQAAGVLNGYLDPQGLTRALADEVSGRGAFGGRAKITDDLVSAEQELETLKSVFTEAMGLGSRLMDETEVRFVAEAMQRTGLDEALERLAIKTVNGPLDIAQAVRRADAPGPLEDMQASRDADMRIPDDFLAGDMEYWDAMVKQMADDPSVEAELMAIRDIEAHAAAFAEVAEAAATCLARSL